MSTAAECQRKSRTMRRLGIRRLVMFISEAQLEQLIAAGVSEAAIDNPYQISRALIDALNQPLPDERPTSAPARPTKARRKAGDVPFTY